MKLDELLSENIDPKVKKVADRVIDDFAEEKYFNHDAIVSKVRDLLSSDPEFKDNADKLNRALTAVSNYIK